MNSWLTKEQIAEGYAEYHAKLEKLEQLLRKRIELYKDSPLDHPDDLQMNWRVQEEIYATLCGFLKEAGLE